MEASLGERRWDWRQERAWGALESLLQVHSEGIAGIAALDRLVEYGMREHEAAQFLDSLRASGRIEMRDGRWSLV